MRRLAGRLVAWVTCLLALAGTARAQIDPFYLYLERDAAAAAARGDAAPAARLYRIACFGMLDDPPRLAACTARLALQQAAARDREGFDESFSRLATIEARFQGWTLADLTPSERASMARVAGALLPAETLATIPSLAELATQSRTPPAEPEREADRRRGREAKPTREAKTAQSVAPSEGPQRSEVAEKLPAESVAEPVAEASTHLAASAETAADPLAPDDRERLEAARALLAGRPERAELEAAVAVVREVVDRYPERPELARLLGDIGYRLADWPLCAESYARAGDPGPEAPLERFYMAVCLFETGRRSEAAAILEPSASRLKRSPFVESYIARILPPAELP